MNGTRISILFHHHTPPCLEDNYKIFSTKHMWTNSIGLSQCGPSENCTIHFTSVRMSISSLSPCPDIDTSHRNKNFKTKTIQKRNLIYQTYPFQQQQQQQQQQQKTYIFTSDTWLHKLKFTVSRHGIPTMPDVESFQHVVVFAYPCRWL